MNGEREKIKEAALYLKAINQDSNCPECNADLKNVVKLAYRLNAASGSGGISTPSGYIVCSECGATIFCCFLGTTKDYSVFMTADQDLWLKWKKIITRSMHEGLSPEETKRAICEAQ